jgi:hypothetical protein
MYPLRLYAAVMFLAGVSTITTTPLAAQGGPPTDAATQIDLPDACAFPVTLSLQGKVKTIELPDRSIVIAPGQKVTITNTYTGKQVTLNITGSWHVTQLPNGNSVFDVTGRNLLWGGTLTTLTLTIGNFSFTLDSNFTEVSPLEGYGMLTDVCAALT